MKTLKLQLIGSFKQLPQLLTKIKTLGYAATSCEHLPNLVRADYILFFAENEGFTWLRNNPNIVKKAILCTPSQIVVMRDKGVWYRFPTGPSFQVLTIENIINAITSLVCENLSSWEIIRFSPELACKPSRVSIRKAPNISHNVRNCYSGNYSKNKTIHELFEEQVSKSPNNIAAAIYKASELNHIELDEKVKHLISSGLSRSEVLIAILEIVTHSYTLVEDSYPDDRINYILSDSGSKVVLSNNLQKSIN